MRTAKKVLDSMNNATLAAIGAVEDLEQSADAARDRQADRAAQKPGKRLEKRLSVRHDLEEKKAQIAARPAPETVARGQEAAL